MHVSEHAASLRARFQFSLRMLLELTAICAVLFAASAATGIAASGCLAVMAVFLTLRCGLLALFALAGAMISGDEGGVVIFMSLLLCVWFGVRRWWRTPDGLFQRTDLEIRPTETPLVAHADMT
jgi:hypothetical protein